MSLGLLFTITLPVVVPFWAVYSSPSLAGLQVLLAWLAGSAAIWAHLITFDLFVGRWIFLDARQRRIPPLVTSPLLLFTILVSSDRRLGAADSLALPRPVRVCRGFSRRPWPMSTSATP